MVGMTAHEVDGREVELSSTGGASSDLEDARDVGVGELLDLLALLGRLGAVRGDESLVL
jgi:hypothetical protein